MAPKAAVSNSEIYKVLKRLPIFYENGLLKPELDNIWLDACRALNNKIKKKNLYLKVSRKKLDLFEKLKQKADEDKKFRHGLQGIDVEKKNYVGAERGIDLEDSTTEDDFSDDEEKCEDYEVEEDEFCDHESDKEVRDKDGNTLLLKKYVRCESNILIIVHH